MYNKKDLRRFLPGGINDGGGWDFPSGTFRPFDLGSGFGFDTGPVNDMTEMALDDAAFDAMINQPSAPDENQPEESDLVIQEKRAKTNWTLRGEELVNAFNNVGIRYPLGIARRRQMNKQNYQLELDNADPIKEVGSTNEIDEGNTVAYGQRVGLQGDQGQDRNSRATFGNFAGDQQISKYGGFMQEGGSSGYKVGQIVEMEPWELEQFLAAGGEVDYI